MPSEGVPTNTQLTEKHFLTGPGEKTAFSNNLDQKFLRRFGITLKANLKEPSLGRFDFQKSNKQSNAVGTLADVTMLFRALVNFC